MSGFIAVNRFRVGRIPCRGVVPTAPASTGSFLSLVRGAQISVKPRFFLEPSNIRKWTVTAERNFVKDSWHRVTLHGYLNYSSKLPLRSPLTDSIQEVEMYSRNVSFKLKSKCSAEFTSILEAQIIPLLRRQKGFDLY